MKIAIIGQGYMARTHVEAWSQLGYGDAIKYINAPGERVLEAAPHAEFVNDLNEALFDPEITVLSVCTPTPSHADVAIRALRAGKNVLLEKPIALTIADAEAIALAARESGRLLMVAQVVRFFAGYERLRSVWEAGDLGQLVSARAVRAINRPTWADWWADESQSGGVPVDFAIHDYDQMNLFLGDPVAVTAVRPLTDGPIETTIEYASGAVGQVLSYADTAVGVPFLSSIDLVGTRGIGSYRLAAGSPTDAATADSSLRVATPDRVYSEELADNAPYAREIEYFVDCLERGAEPARSSTESAILALRISLAVRESLSGGGRVTLPLPVHEGE